MIKKKIETTPIDKLNNAKSTSIIQTARSQIGTTFIPDQIISLLTNEPNYRLEELCFRLVNQKIEVEKSINNNIPIQHQSFKNNLYKELETLLLQIAYLDNAKERNQKIESVYKWYKDKMKYYLSLVSMKIKTYVDKNEIIESPKEEKEPQNINDEISALHHRTNFAKGFNLKLYKLKKIRVKKKEKQVIQRNLIPKPKEYYKSENNNNKIPTAKQEISPSPNVITTNITSSTVPTTNRELKSSYSYGMPKFTFSQANVESTIITAKQRELELKRTQEEIAEAINDFGTKRALFKGINQKKYDTKEVIKYYSLMNQENINNIKECEEEKTSFSQNTVSKQKDENYNNNNIHNRIIHRCKSQIITAKDKENVFNKVILNKVRNISIDDKNKIVKSKKETNITISLKQNHNLSRQKLLQNKSMNFDDYPSDSIMARISIDSLFKARLEYKKLDNLSNRSLEISRNINDNNKYLSAYDMNNCKLFDKLDNSVRSQSNNSNNGNNIIREKLRNCSSDFLNLRQTMQSFQINNVMNLKKSMKKSKKFNRSCLVDAFVNPSRNTFYPKYYLPITGSGLLSKPIEIETRQKKNHSILQ